MLKEASVQVSFEKYKTLHITVSEYIFSESRKAICFCSISIFLYLQRFLFNSREIDQICSLLALKYSPILPLTLLCHVWHVKRTSEQILCTRVFSMALRPFVPRINKQWEVIALEQLTSHMTLNAGPQQQRSESPTITPPGMR